MIADDFQHPWPPVEPGERRFKRERSQTGHQTLYYRCIPGQCPVYFRVTSGRWLPSGEFTTLDELLRSRAQEIIPSALMVSEGL